MANTYLHSSSLKMLAHAQHLGTVDFTFTFHLECGQEVCSVFSGRVHHAIMCFNPPGLHSEMSTVADEGHATWMESHHGRRCYPIEVVFSIWVFQRPFRIFGPDGGPKKPTSSHINTTYL